jgi:hypothetical protein
MRLAWTAAYEDQLLCAAASDSTWELAKLAWQSVCEESQSHGDIPDLPHLHCITDTRTACKSCRKGLRR